MDDMNKNGGGQDDIKIWNNPKSNRTGRRRNVYVVTTEGEPAEQVSPSSGEEGLFESYGKPDAEHGNMTGDSNRRGENAESAFSGGQSMTDQHMEAGPDQSTDGRKNGSQDHASEWGMDDFHKARNTRNQMDEETRPQADEENPGKAVKNSDDRKKKSSKKNGSDQSEAASSAKKGFFNKKEKPQEKADSSADNGKAAAKKRESRSESRAENRTENRSGKENLLGKGNLSKSERRSIWQSNTLDGTERDPFHVRAGNFLHNYGFKLIAIVLVFAIVIGASLLYNRNRTYSKGDVQWQISASVNKSTRYYLFGKRILCCSQNGVSCIDQNGSVLWNRTYDMDVPTLVIKGSYAVVYDMKGTSLYILNEDGCTGSNETLKPILKADVSASGVVAVVLDDTTCNYINYYDKDGLLLNIEIKTLINGDGYPVDIAISPDGTELMTSYIYSENGSMLNQVVFRNFELGKNESDRVVGGFKDYGETLVADVVFFDDQHAVAITENTIDFYSTRNARKPALSKRQEITKKIKSVFYNESYIGVITGLTEIAERETDSVSSVPATDETQSAEADTSEYIMTVYDKEGGKVFTTKLNFEYTTAEFSGDGLVVYNNSQCAVYNMTGVCKYQTDAEYGEIAGLLRIDETTLVLYGNEALRMLKLK